MISDDVARLSHDDDEIEHAASTVSEALIDSLKSQLQQSTLSLQTNNIQLAAIKQAQT